MTVYFVSTTGSDANSGAIGQPFASLEHAHGLARPGDTIYLRGGTYVLDKVLTLTTSGEAGKPITVSSFQGEKVVLDGSGIPTPDEFNGRTVHLERCLVQPLQGPRDHQRPRRRPADRRRTPATTSSSRSWRITMAAPPSPKGPASRTTARASDNLFLNCDSYANYDVLGGGENADGFAVDAGAGNVLRGCRAWNNSDDGFDFFNASFESNRKGSAVLAEECWAWENGYDPNGIPRGDGDGFKLGGQRPGLGNTSGGHLVVNCVSWDNLHDGFEGNDAAIPITVLNSTAFDNHARNFHFNIGGHVLKNNLCYSPGQGIYLEVGTVQVANSWNLNVVVSSADFLSLSDAVARGPRQADGALPETTFLHLAPDSDLIDKGVNVGLPSEGKPDLGAFETGTALDPTEAPGKTIVGSNRGDLLTGTPGDDTIKGRGGNDRLKGLDGADKLAGANGNDRLLGGGDDDALKGGKGKDRLAGDLGDDVLTGGKHKDTFVFKDDFGEDRITDFKPGTDKMVFEATDFADFAAVKAAMYACAEGVMIETGGSAVLVENVKVSDLHAGDFLLV
jgi:Ca2+-binding RTX toxin-like protein